MTDQPSTTSPQGDLPVSVDLLCFYDEFVDFQSQCAFFCDAVTTMLTAQTEFDRATLEGICSFSGNLKGQIATLKEQLKQIQEKACAEG